MAPSRQTMTDEQRKSVALEYSWPCGLCCAGVVLLPADIGSAIVKRSNATA
jgi:hypothetical protein